MASNKYIKIETDLEKLQERVDEISSEVSFDEVKSCVADLKEALYEHPEIAALCAPQIGKKLRLFVVRTAKTETERFKIFLNPLIVKQEGLHLSREINLSIPDTQVIIPRNNEVHVAFQTLDGHIDSNTYIGPFGEVVQQMIQMLDGILITDYGLNLNDLGGPEAFDAATEEEKMQVIDLYINQLKKQSSDINLEIEKSEDLSEINKTIDFMTGMLTGEIKPVTSEEMEKIKNGIRI